MKSKCDETPHQEDRSEEHKYTGNIVESLQRVHLVHAYIWIRARTSREHFCRSSSNRVSLYRLLLQCPVCYTIGIVFPGIIDVNIPEIVQAEKNNIKHSEKQNREECDEEECFESIGPDR